MLGKPAVTHCNGAIGDCVRSAARCTVKCSPSLREIVSDVTDRPPHPITQEQFPVCVRICQFTQYGKTMGFQYFGPAQTLNVTDVAATISLWSLPQIRVWNKGLNPCRIRYSSTGAAATSSDMVMPNGLVEVHTRTTGQDWLSAICAPGETAVLEIISGQGD